MVKFALPILVGLLFFAFVLRVSAHTPAFDDPFPPEVESCLRAALGDERFKAIFFEGSQPTREEAPKLEECFRAYGEPVPVEEWPSGLIKCLKNAVGEERYYAIDSGQSEPTAEEMSKAEPCFQQYGIDPGPPDSPYDTDIHSELMDCLINAVGEERFYAIKSGQAEPTPEEVSKVQKCFEAYSDIVPPPPAIPPPDDFGMPPELIDCLINALGEERFHAIESGQAQPTPEETTLGEQCFQGYVGEDYDTLPPGTLPPDVGPFPMDPWLEGCLREAVGDERFEAISSGQSEPTEVEEQKGIACFDNLGHERPAVVSAPDDVIHLEVLQCLRLALGEERFTAISEGTASATLADREKAEKCFGSVPAPISPPPRVVLDEHITACLKTAVGEERFQAINSGESQPTPEEQSKGEVCFQSAQPVDGLSPGAILPLPPEQVPYLPENPDAISVDEVSREEEPDSDDTESVTLNGTAPLGGIVDIYIHSPTAIVASTEADSSGRWSYTVLGLEKGSHLVYATSRIDGEVERSAAMTFQADTTEGVNWVLWGLVWGLVAAAGILVLMILWADKDIGARKPIGSTGRPSPPS